MDKIRAAVAAVIVLASMTMFATLILFSGDDPRNMVLWGSVSASVISLACLVAAVLFYSKTPSERYVELHPPEEDDPGRRI